MRLRFNFHYLVYALLGSALLYLGFCGPGSDSIITEKTKVDTVIKKQIQIDTLRDTITQRIAVEVNKPVKISQAPPNDSSLCDSVRTYTPEKDIVFEDKKIGRLKIFSRVQGKLLSQSAEYNLVKENLLITNTKTVTVDKETIKTKRLRHLMAGIGAGIGQSPGGVFQVSLGFMNRKGWSLSYEYHFVFVQSNLNRYHSIQLRKSLFSF